MAKVADGSRGDDAKTVGNRGMEVDELDEDVEETGVQEGNPAIDEVTLEIFMPPSSVRLEDNVFITEEGIRDGQDVGRNDEEEIVDARIEKVMEDGVDKGAKESVPTANPQVSQGLVAWITKESE